jgi:hypothetical protein
MRKSLLVIAALLLPTFSALAQQPGVQKSEKAAASGKTLPLKGASSANSCAAYGPGFVKLEGSDTCVKVGGAFSVGVGAGTSRGAH